MEIWIDAQLSPSIALWMNQTFPGVNVCSIRSLGLRDANDRDIFQQAKAKGAAIMSKDADFVKLLEAHGPPPQIIWITIGNTSNASMREVIKKNFLVLMEMLNRNEPLIEVDSI